MDLLSKRQLDVLFAVAEEGSIKGAAVALGINEQTVKNHLGLILKKTGSKTTLQAYHRLVRGVRLVSVVSQQIETED